MFSFSSASRNRVRVRVVLLIFAMEQTAYSRDRGQGVQRVLHCEIEDEEWATPPLLLAMELASPSSSSSISQVGCILHREDEE